MDYKQKYKDALERARLINNGEGVEAENRTSICEAIFPELKESKTEWVEKIRKELKDYLSHRTIKKISESDAVNQWLAWLERQGEQKPVEWKQENVEELTEFENAMMHIGGSFFGKYKGLDPNDTNIVKEQGNLLLKLAQKPVEWSKEDERIKNSLITSLARISANTRTDSTSINYCFSKEIDWLKSLRPQKRWKPSKEQMKVLLGEVNGWTEGCPKQKVLESLYNDLKKLMEE